MIPMPKSPDTDGERIDLHNATIDEGSVAAGGCGMIHLPTGRICRAGAGHADGCDFVTAP